MNENQGISQLIHASEKRELADFELLEQLAKDDVSFLSSLSTVDKILEDHHVYTSNAELINSKMKDQNRENLFLDNQAHDLKYSFAFDDNLVSSNFQNLIKMCHTFFTSTFS